jgi:DUF1680 family protein
MNRAIIQGDFWLARLGVNACQAIFHQWEQLENSGCIENFRIAAGQAEGFREGWFFADSDAYKWLEAASRICAAYPDPRLAALIDSFIILLSSAQAPDGYLFTYNQIHFPTTRWQNLQIEHELYCHGHLIEAGVSHYEATGRTDLLDIARRAADRVVEDFLGKGPAYTPGHEEIEIALLRLHMATPGDTAYIAMARQFIEQRGRMAHFALSLVSQNLRVNQRGRLVRQRRQAYLASHPGFKPFRLPPANVSQKPPSTVLRWLSSVLSGKYFQQHAPVREQIEPVGHAVRFAYLETAVAMLARETGDRSLLPTLERAWEHMIARRMYITGGLGAQPGLEGFGGDYELEPQYAYAETCAALGSLFWNWEMVLLTGEAKYSDLFEWQLYNAAAVGMGLDGKTYFYNNPLACRQGVTRQPWYDVPCCPSNLSRTWANLSSYIFSCEPGNLRVHQYISSSLHEVTIPVDSGTISVNMTIESGLPWEGRVQIKIVEISRSHPAQRAPEMTDQPVVFALHLRLPTWAGSMEITINGGTASQLSGIDAARDAPATGYDPRLARFHTLQRAWSPSDVVVIYFDMPVRLLHAHPRVKGHSGKAAVTRGPLVYCLESIDNPGIDIFSTRLDPGSLAPLFDDAMLGGAIKVQGNTKEKEPLRFIPYFLWGNRGVSSMTVWVNT